MTNKITEKEFEQEREHAELVTSKLVEVIDEETGILAQNREKVMDDRAYFIDYFREMHKDEREDWLQMEHANIKRYDLTKTSIDRLGKMLSNPYFGKIVFKDEKTGKDNEYYIGLYALNRDYVNYIVDWRAPVSDLYYENEPGLCSYTIPAGERRGELTQKRRLMFEEGILKKAQNIKLPSDDEFLNDMLAQNSSDYLKVIVSTLQSDQNKIIRDFVDGIHIICGCAGSGKSSIAMHKIAYIMYSCRDKLKNSNIVVLSPNMAFASYISRILPDLGEENVMTITQEEMIDDITRGSLENISTRDDSTERMLIDEDPRVLASVKYKNSEKFRALVNQYAKWYSKHCFNEKDLIFDSDGSEDFIEKRIHGRDLGILFYNELDDKPIADRIDIIFDFLCRKNHIVDDGLRNEIKKQLDEMMKPMDMNIIYKDMFFNEEFISTVDKSLYPDADELSYYYLEPLMWEDKVAVASLKLDFYGCYSDVNVFYVFCDEAQDLSPLMIQIIKKCYSSSNMLFAGDLSQNVFANSSDYVQTIKSAFPGHSFKNYELNVNYRSTKQISEFACNRTGRTNEISAVREGDDPTIVKSCGKPVHEIAGEWLAEVNEKGYERVAVVTVTKAEADDINFKIELPERLKVKVHFLPVYLAKGLEYDAVLLVNENGKMEEKDKTNGTNLFYTGCTRAMHDLTVIE